MAAVETATQTTDDYALMEAVAAGDQAALASLYDRHSSLVYSLCLRILHDRMDSEDLLMDVFWELWSRADRYDPARGTPLTYLLILARSRAIDRRRSGLKRHARRAQFEAAQDGNGAGISPVATGPVGQALSRELADKMRAALNKIDPAQRQAVELSFFDDLSHTEIAEQLGKPLGTVKTYIRQGLIRLREFVRKD